LKAGWTCRIRRGRYFGEAGIEAEGHAAHRVEIGSIGPHFEFSTIVDRAVRAELIRPTYLLVRLTTGAEF